MVGDNRYLIIRRLVETVGGTPSPGDLETDLLEKYLTAIGGTPVPGDSFINLLVKIVTIKGGTPRPGDNEWNLLMKWLETEGQCLCNGMIIDLWRKLLSVTDSCGENQPDSVVLAQAGPGGPFNVSWSPAVPGVQYIITRSLNGGAWTVAAVEDGLNVPFEGADVGVANGDAVRFGVRVLGTDLDCQAISNTVIAAGF